MAADLAVAEPPTLGRRIRRLVVESPGSLGSRARSRRWDLIRELFPELPDMRVLDLGGRVETWHTAPVRPAHVTVVNLLEPGTSDEPTLVPLFGDACAARAELEKNGATTSYDLVFSNSLIEHVGGHAKRAELAREIDALAPYHWVQTPYRYFPVEPHWLFPMMQFLPLRMRVAVATHWPLVHSRPDSRTAAESSVLWTELVSITEMQSLFPSSQIVRERLAGLTKSISAARSFPRSVTRLCGAWLVSGIRAMISSSPRAPSTVRSRVSPDSHAVG